jgi:hypothetical protein
VVHVSKFASSANLMPVAGVLNTNFTPAHSELSLHASRCRWMCMWSCHS